MTKLLIDECLSDRLAHVARQRGYYEASHIRWIGKAGWKDWNLKKVLLTEDWVLVTRNGVDFRGPRETPGSKGQYADVSLHAGLICFNAPVGMKLRRQTELLHKALDELDADGDLTNQVLEVTCFEARGPIEVDRYNFPMNL